MNQANHLIRIGIRAIFVLTLAGCGQVVLDSSPHQVIIGAGLFSGDGDEAATSKAQEVCALHGRKAVLLGILLLHDDADVRYTFACVD